MNDRDISRSGEALSDECEPTVEILHHWRHESTLGEAFDRDVYIYAGLSHNVTVITDAQGKDLFEMQSDVRDPLIIDAVLLAISLGPESGRSGEVAELRRALGITTDDTGDDTADEPGVTDADQ